MGRISGNCSGCTISPQQGVYFVLEAGASGALIALRTGNIGSPAFKIIADFFTGFFGWGAFEHGVRVIQPEKRNSLMSTSHKGRQEMVLERISLFIRAFSPTIFFVMTEAGYNDWIPVRATNIATVASAGVVFREEILAFVKALRNCRPSVGRSATQQVNGQNYESLKESSEHAISGSLSLSETLTSVQERRKKGPCEEIDTLILVCLSILSGTMGQVVVKEPLLKNILEFLMLYFPASLAGRLLYRILNLFPQGEKISIIFSSYSPYLQAAGFAPIIGIHGDVSKELISGSSILCGFSHGYEAQLLKARIGCGVEHLPEFRNTKMVPFSDKKGGAWKDYFAGKISWVEGSSCSKIAASIMKLILHTTLFCVPLAALGGFAVQQMADDVEAKTDVEAMAALLAGSILGTLVGWSLTISGHSQDIENISRSRRALNYLFKKLFVFPDIFYVNPAILYYVMLSIMKLNSDAIKGASQGEQTAVILAYFALGFCSTLATFQKIGVSGFNREQPPDIYTLQIIATLTFFFSPKGNYE